MANRGSPAIEIGGLNLWYGDFQALFDVNLSVERGLITSMIGPSGCGKTTLLRSCNRIAERAPGVRTTGEVRILGRDIYAPDVEILQVRQQVGMVFQRPNPLPVSIRENVLFGYRLHAGENGRRSKEREDEVVESALKRVLLWDEVKNRLSMNATELSLERQQKLCIARLLPVKPQVLLMDEPCSALDPAGTEAVEELIYELRGDYSILIVTHNMAQAKRASDHCVFMLLGRVVERGPTVTLFASPKRRSTAQYIAGRYG